MENERCRYARMVNESLAWSVIKNEERERENSMTHGNLDIIDGICYNFSAILFECELSWAEPSWSININGVSPVTLIDLYMLNMVSPCTHGVWHTYAIAKYTHNWRTTFRQALSIS